MDTMTDSLGDRPRAVGGSALARRPLAPRSSAAGRLAESDPASGGPDDESESEAT